MTDMTLSTCFSVERPLTPIDCINRRAAATGSVGYAIATADADYNGHPVRVSYKPQAVSGPTWNAEYYWGGRVVLARGGFEACLDAAMREYNRGARGASVTVTTSELAPESRERQEMMCRDRGLTDITGRDPYAKPAWWTGTHHAVVDANFWLRCGHHQGIMETALAFEGTPEEWPAARDAFIASLKEA